ncbi:MAG: M20/M25/M40 family metallo-hydrolase [Candidatus Aminicenantes bacterium]|nr:M20/M25/M40 family metallo-hydrolase [Candidatus Aminicenantes bacterium]
MSKSQRQKILFFILAVWLSPAAATASSTSPGDSITAAKLKGHVYFLTSDFLEGRYPGSKGYRIAAEYAVSQFKAAGLLPIIEPNGQKSYFQSVPLAKRTVQEAAKVSLRAPGGEKIFAGGDLKLYASEGLSGDGKSRPVVFAGFGIREPAAGWDDFKGLNIAGKVVLLMMGAPAKGGKPVLPPELNKIYIPMNSINRKLMAAREAAAVFVLLDETLLEAFESLPAVPEGPQFVLDDEEAGAFRIPPLGFLSVGLSQAIFGGRGLPDPAAVSEGRVPREELRDVALAVNVPFSDEKVETSNVIGLVQGSDPVLKDEVVVVSAHLDHLPPTPEGQIHPGANDNASGAAALLEIAGAVASRPPRRTVLLALFSAEEGGDMGARYFLARGPVSRAKIIADVNMDMIGRTEEGLESDQAQYVLDSGRITPALTRLIEEVNRRTVGWALRFEHPRGLGDSDHRAFEALGIPAVNFYTGRIPDTHQPTDTPDKLDYEKAAKIARLVYEITMELANRERL